MERVVDKSCYLRKERPAKTTRDTSRKVKDLRKGEEGWVVPWSLYFDIMGFIVGIDEEATVHKNATGTAEVHVYKNVWGRLEVNIDLVLINMAKYNKDYKEMYPCVLVQHNIAEFE